MAPLGIETGRYESIPEDRRVCFNSTGIVENELHVLINCPLYGPRQANLVLIAYASSEGSGEPAHPRSLAKNPRCSLIQAVSQEEPSDRKPDPWPL